MRPIDYDEFDSDIITPYSAGEQSYNKSGYEGTSQNKSGQVTTNETTENHRDRGQVYLQEANKAERNANADMSQLQAMLGVNRRPMADPSAQQSQARKQMIANGLYGLATAMVRGGVSDAQGTTGPIHKDASNPYYLTAFKNYSSAIPDYNKAVAKENAALVKAQGDLAKAQYNGTVKYDLADQKNLQMAGYGNAKAQNTEEQNYQNGNKWSEKSVGKTFNVNTTGSKTYSEGGNKTAQERRDDRGGGSGSGKSNNSMMTQQPYIAMTSNGREVKGGLQMTKGDFKNLLRHIDAIASEDNGEITKLTGEMALPSTATAAGKEQRRQMLASVKKLQQSLNEDFYKKYGRPTTNTTDEAGIKSAAYNADTLNDDQLENLWAHFTKTFSMNRQLELLHPYMMSATINKQPFFTWESNNMGTRIQKQKLQ